MSKAKVFIVDRDYQADYKVFFVDQAHKEKNAHIIKGGQPVDRSHSADVKIFIEDREYKADIKIMRKNFPK